MSISYRKVWLQFLFFSSFLKKIYTQEACKQYLEIEVEMGVLTNLDLSD